MKKKINKYLYWTPRILSLVFAAFLVIFSFDVFEEGLGFWQTALAFFIHNIPVLLLLAVAIIAWKRELVGAIGYGLFSLWYIYFAVSRTGFSLIALSWFGIIGVPAVLTSVLYYLNWHYTKKA